MVSYEFQDNVAVLRMDDGKANALNGSSLTSLELALDATSSARALVLGGRGGFFSGGLDLKNLPSLPPDQLQSVLRQFIRAVRRLMESPAPIVAAVSGHALAGGAVLALACDYTIGIPGAFKVGLNEAAIGIPLPKIVVEMGKSKLLPQAWIRAMAHGEVFFMEDALKVGYIDELADPAELEIRALAKASALAALPPGAYLATKNHIRAAALACAADDAVTPLMSHFQARRG